MTQFLRKEKFKKTMLVALSMLYLVTPLHTSILKGFHKIEHFISQTASDHEHEHKTHHAHGEEHPHEHKTIAFVTSIFSNQQVAHTSETNSSETNKVTKILSFDKHLTLQEYASDVPFAIDIKHIFTYSEAHISTILEHTTPPPELRFS
ncbi:hypothetical protein ACFQO1_01335 [Jejudonia soesokkakensis]|uniref:Uncharacterized protein n=1 Tax=Jejudonia soesokkakensis TaxID=1323432 RepID=A0ABW2MSQ9_9FLAO